MNLLWCVALFLCATCCVGELIFHEGEVKVVNNIIELTNTHRPGGVLKFSVNGANVSKVTFKSEQWNFELSDKTVMHLNRFQAWMSSSREYRFTWPGAGPSLDREICFHYGYNNASWFSTYEEKNQRWPLDTTAKVAKGKSFTTQDFGHTNDFGSIIEYIFLSSDGFVINLDQNAPWFLRRDPNNGEPVLCVAVSDKAPYTADKAYQADYNTIGFHILNGHNLKVAYDNMIQHFTDWIWKPFEHPDEHVFTYPIWSTWAYYHQDINQSKVLEFAHNIKKYNLKASHIEIDDKWEAHFGDFTFDPKKFDNSTKMIHELKELGLKTTVWVYPFVNTDSMAFEEGKNHSYFVANKTDPKQPALIKWWHDTAGIIDFSHYQSSEWFINRLMHAKHELGVDSFKFDAGELNWYEANTNFSLQFARRVPNYITHEYVKACSRLGKMVEVRAGFKSQQYPVLVRMFDRASKWTFESGLKSLIPTALTMSIAGYDFILPDMVGGNDLPSEELYIRWVQASTFLPSMQFSIPPWAFNDTKVINITRQAIDLHAEHAPTIIALAKDVPLGKPIIQPMWFASPDDLSTYKIDDQFMLGEEIVVAPVLEQGAKERSVYLPKGNWIDQTGKLYTGPGRFRVLAPLEVLPFFKRQH